MKLRALALSLILVVSLLAGSVAFAGSAAAAPSGMVGVPGENIQDVRADGGSISANELTVYTDDHASTTHVSIVTESQADKVASGTSLPDVANEKVCATPAANKNPNANCYRDTTPSLVLSDDTHHEGRTIAIDATQLQDALGEIPGFVTVRNSETGERWQQPTREEDGWVYIEAPHFSDNAVTWGGEVDIGNTFTDGSSVQYDLGSYDAASNITVNTTGVTNTGWKNISKTAAGDGEPLNFGVGGNADPEASVVFTGIENKPHNIVDDEGDGSVDASRKFAGDIGDGKPVNSEAEVVPESSGELQNLTIDVASPGDDPVTVDIYIEKAPIDQSVGGTKIKDNWGLSSSGVQTIQLDTPYNVSAGSTYTIGFQSTGDSDGQYTDDYDIGVDQSASSVKFAHWVNGWSSTTDYANITLGIPKSQTKDPAVDVDGDGSPEASVTGTIADGEEITRDLSLTTTDYSGSISLSEGEVDVSIPIKERTVTDNPAIQLNGNTTTLHSGTLADGETVQTTIPKEQLQEGTNQFNVSLGDGSLSADAPAMQAQIEYSHDAEDIQTVSYDAEKFSERYNVSKTFASDRTDPTLTVPFADTAVAMRDLEYRVNGGTWQSLPESDYTISNTTLTAELPDASADDTYTVRANASKVTVQNGAIEVTETTIADQQLDSKITVTDSTSDNLILGVGDAPSAKRIHYAYDRSYPGDGDYNLIYQNQHTLVLPDAGLGDTTRISTIPVSAEPQTNDVAVTVENPQTTEPVFDVGPGNTNGDEIEFTFVDAQDDTKYVLYSKTDNIVRDSGTANSPLTLSDDDSDEVLQFQLDDGGASSSDGGSDGNDVLGPTGDTEVNVDFSGLARWLGLLGVVSLGLFGLIYWRGGPEAATAAAKTAGSGVRSTFGWIGGGLASAARWLRYHPLIAATVIGGGILALFATGMLALPDGAGIVLVVTIAVIGSYIVLRRWASASMTVWAIGALATTVVGLEALGTPVVESLISSEGFVVLIIAGAALAWRYFSVRETEASTPEEVNNVNFGTPGESGNSDSGSD
jgi:surface glycoprotein (TIGR04207 family)